VTVLPMLVSYKRTYITGTLGYDSLDTTTEPKVTTLMISYDNGRNFSAVKAEKEPSLFIRSLPSTDQI